MCVCVCLCPYKSKYHLCSPFPPLCTPARLPPSPVTKDGCVWVTRKRWGEKERHVHVQCWCTRKGKENERVEQGAGRQAHVVRGGEHERGGTRPRVCLKWLKGVVYACARVCACVRLSSMLRIFEECAVRGEEERREGGRVPFYSGVRPLCRTLSAPYRPHIHSSMNKRCCPSHPPTET